MTLIFAIASTELGWAVSAHAHEVQSSSLDEANTAEKSSTAQPTAPKRTTRTGKIIVANHEETVAADSSEVMRDDKTLNVNVIGFGFDGDAQISGIELGYFLSPNLVIGARRSESDPLSGSWYGQFTSYGVSAKKFWSNSFYTTLALTHYNFTSEEKSSKTLYNHQHAQSTCYRPVIAPGQLLG